MLPRMVLTQVSAGCRALAGPLPGHERLVKAPCVSHGTKAGQGVGHDDGAGLEVTSARFNRRSV